MESRLLQFVIEACGGQPRGIDPMVKFQSVSTDTRKLQRGDLFVALRGDNFDGNQFAAAAIAAGAVAAVVDSPCVAPSLLVPDARLALGQLATAHREEMDAVIFGIAGSNGKTSTKEMLAAMLRAKIETLHSEASFNNDIGVPTTLLSLRPHHRVAVLELGTNHPGELLPLVKMAAPQFGLLTGIGREHLEFFKTLEGVAREEGVLGELLPAGGKLFLYGDDDWSQSIAERSNAPVTTVGFSEGNDWRADDVEVTENGTHFVVRAPTEKWSGEYTTPLLGRHQAANATLGIAAAAGLGVDRETIARGLAECPAPAMRLQLREKNGVRWLNDAYNANADSVVAALETLASLEVMGKRYAVLGDMAELGEHDEPAHREAGERAASRVDGLIAVGANAAITVGAARDAGLIKTEVVPDVEAAACVLRKWLQSDDAVLLKASRAARLEQLEDLI
ncbi:UDP-N-acetylmuramoyl-tripeptide--D-alanyl-D-alanine ligase [Verrucomicrobia bacterium]|nr:UDP-N-acetylmuramoyl-tripeptide--D-alanyl-D-alanine ligase [Verrucomicrobiota bacterium]